MTFCNGFLFAWGVIIACVSAGVVAFGLIFIIGFIQDKIDDFKEWRKEKRSRSFKQGE